MSRIVKHGKHVCSPPEADGPSMIWECDCGRRWKYWAPGNPRYEGWRETYPSAFGIRRRNARNDGVEIGSWTEQYDGPEGAKDI